MKDFREEGKKVGARILYTAPVEESIIGFTVNEGEEKGMLIQIDASVPKALNITEKILDGVAQMLEQAEMPKEVIPVFMFNVLANAMGKRYGDMMKASNEENMDEIIESLRKTADKLEEGEDIE